MLITLVMAGCGPPENRGIRSSVLGRRRDAATLTPHEQPACRECL